VIVPGKKTKGLLISFIILLGLIGLMDSCMQFRMSRQEINHFFENKKYKGRLYQYKVNNQTINYLQAGDTTKPLIVFVHGSPGSLSAFIHFMGDTLLLEKAQLISVDRPGFGESNFGFGMTSLKQQVDCIQPILKKHKSNHKVILVGHSMGGPFIARMAMDYPDLIDGLVIVAGSIAPDLEPNETWFRAPLSTPFLRWMLPRSFRASNTEIYHLKPDLQDMVARWKKITCPVVVIQGGKDLLVDPRNADFAKEMLVNSKSVKIIFKKEMNHFVPWSNPELIQQAVLELLSSL
jgi:pimeloyl-ACP methyl ester carboxylesterase